MIHRVAGPVAADPVITERHAVARIVGEDGSQLASDVMHGKQRQVMIDGATSGSTVLSEIDFSDAPRQSRRSSIGQSGDGHLFQFGFKFRAVFENVVPMNR